MKDGVYLHYSLGWVLLEARGGQYWLGRSEHRSFASAKIAAQRRAIGLGLPYKGECKCLSCESIPRNVWAELKHIIVDM